jgi:hypothetical protein
VGQDKLKNGSPVLGSLSSELGKYTSSSGSLAALITSNVSDCPRLVLFIIVKYGDVT